MFYPFRFAATAAGALLFSLSLRAEGPLAAALQGPIDHHVATGSVGLVADGQKILDLEAAGVSNLSTKAPMKTDAVFWIASMTKSFTAAALMMLVDEGKVKLDDPVEKYLPEFKGQKVMEKGDATKLRAPSHPITVREVMDHTSGLVLAGDKSLKRTYSLKDDVAQFAAAPLRQDPGTKFEYNNSGINTGARIIEVVSGMPYTEFLQKRVLDPLGMSETTFWPTEAMAKRLANSARFTADKSNLEDVDFLSKITPNIIEKVSHGVKVPHEVLANFGLDQFAEYGHRYGDGAGGLFSTATDLAKFGQMLLNKGTWQGKRLLSEEAVRELSSIQTGDVMVNPNEGYGVGVFVKKKQDEGLSVGSFGHRGARRTVFWVDPNHRLVLVMLVQRMDMSGEQQKEFYGSFLKAAVEKYGSPSK